MVFVGRVHAVDHRLEVSLHHRERRPELVTHVGEEASPLLLARGEARRHRVERSREGPRFAWTALFDARREIAFSDPAYGVDDIAYRGGEPTQGPRRQADPEKDDEEGDPARDIAGKGRSAERARERPEEKGRGDDRQDRRHHEEHGHAADEPAAHRPRPARPTPPWRERLLLGA